MTMQDKSAEAVRQRAQLRFEKATTQAREAAAALKEHQAQNAAEAAKVNRLRALRLARDAAEAQAAQETEAAKAAAIPSESADEVKMAVKKPRAPRRRVPVQ